MGFVKDDKTGRFRDSRTQRFISNKEASRRQKIGAYTRRRVRDEGGRFDKKRIIVAARTRPKDPKDRFRTVRGERDEVCRTDVFDIEIDVEDPEFREIEEALDAQEPDETHFGVSSFEEVEE